MAGFSSFELHSNSMNRFKSLAAVAAVTAFLTACSSTPIASVDAASPGPAASSSPSAAPVAQTAPKAVSKVEPVVVPAYLDPANALAKDRSFYFDYDNFSVRSEYANQVAMHGKFLASNPKVSIKVEGNADERGSAEYNLALGQKRAAAVVTALKVYGATDAQMEAVSWGREKPLATGHDEASWAKNRRADLIYPSK
jgi:peptidoglycan-associated lipoprotein